MVVAAVAFSFLAISVSSTQAQVRNNYWATDGCYYLYVNNQWTRTCPADQSKTKYYYDVVVNRQWVRVYYLDANIYSEGSTTYKTHYNYSLKAWARNYSNGSVLYYSDQRRYWMTWEDYDKYGELNDAQMKWKLKMEDMMAESNSRFLRNLFAPSCRYDCY